jgi:hypothetical protein
MGVGLLRFASATGTAIWLVSAAALAAVPQLADSGQGPDLITALGDLHTTLFFALAAVLGIALLLCGWLLWDTLPRWSCWLAVAEGVCGVLASFTLGVKDFDLGSGVPPVFVAPYFFGLPLWIAATSVVLALGRGARRDEAVFA